MSSWQHGLNGAILFLLLTSACSPARTPGARPLPSSTATLPPPVLTPLLSSLPTPLAILPEEARKDDASLVFEHLYVIVEVTPPNDLLLYEICLLTNRSRQTVWIPNDDRDVPFLPPPSGAVMLSLRTTSQSAPIQEAASGIALPPAEQPYSLLVLFRLPYAPRTTIEQRLPLPPATITVLAPQELQVSGDNLQEEGERAFGERRFALYRVAPPASTLPLRLTLHDRPPHRARQTEEVLILLGGLGILGAILTSTGLRLLQRQRQRASAQALMDAILDLDERFEQGHLPRQAYEQQRAKLKEQLRKTLSS